MLPLVYFMRTETNIFMTDFNFSKKTLDISDCIFGIIAHVWNVKEFSS